MSDPVAPLVDKLIQRIKALRPVLVKRMARTAEIFIHENFEKQGFQGETFEPWAKRKDPKDQSRPILIGKGSGLLMRSPFTSYTDDEIAIITSSLPYSRIHNEGGDIAHPAREHTMHFDQMPDKGRWRLGEIRTIKGRSKIVGSAVTTIGAHTTHMPKRQFMGRSPVLDKRIKEMITKEAGKAFTIT